MRYRVTVDATVEARDNDDALRLVGKKMLASADQTGSPADSPLTEPLNYWIKVVPEEA